MAPDVLPSVWVELQARIDICSVVREILGHFAIKSVGEAPSASDSFSFIVWMKVIYDLQRTYLQSSDPSSETLSYLLPPRILFKTLRRVLEVRSQLRPAETQNYPAQQPRYFAAQTLLSGVRALQLRGISENSPDLEEVHAIEILIQKWVGETDEALEKFMLNKCHSGLVLMRSGPVSSSFWNKPACNVCELRDNAKDLYPALTNRMMNDLNSQLSQETNNLDSQDQFWARFDIIWAVEAGHIQWCADKLLSKNVIDNKCEVGNVIKILEKTTPDFAMSILNHTWHNRKHGQVHIERVDPDPLNVNIDESLLLFRKFLETRRAKLVDYNSEIRKLSTTLGQNIESWIRRVSGYGKHVDLKGGEQTLKTAYVLGCPILHVVPEHQLRSSIHESYGNNDQIFLNNPELLDLTECPIYCPRCSSRQSTTVIKHARRVDPLNTLSNQLEHLVGTSITPQDSNISQQLTIWRQNKIHGPPSKIQEIESVPARKSEDSMIHGIPSPPSSPNPGSFIEKVARVKSNKSEESKSTRTTGTSRISRIFRIKSSIPSDIVSESTRMQKHMINSYCFSSNGKMLILWNNRANHVYCSVVPTAEDPELKTSWDWMKFGNGLGSVELVASGKTRIALISKEDKKSRLLVFGVSTPPNLEPILEKVLPRDKKLIYKSLCMSLDGRIIGVGADKEVFVYHVDNSINNAELKPRIIKLSALFSGMDVFSQCMNFSQDCKKLVIATRYYNDGNCEIEIILYDLLSGQELPGIKTKPHLFTSTDKGLTAIFYDHRKKEIILTGSINKSYGNVFSSRRNSRTIYWPPESSKIQAAVACSSESQYIFLGSSGGLYSVDLDEERTWKRPSKFGWENKYSVPETPTRSDSSTSFVALAAPDIDHLYTFRIEKEEMILELIQGKGAPVRLGFVGPLSLPLDI